MAEDSSKKSEEKRKAIEARLKEERIPEAIWPEEWAEKKKRPREIAFMDVNLCFPCGKCPEFCPVGCIEYLKPGTLPGRGDMQAVQVRPDECIGCYICVEVCALMTDYDAVRMYPTDMVEEIIGREIGNKCPETTIEAEAYEEHFALGGRHSVREQGKGSRLVEKLNEEERKRQGFPAR
tara:strand:- start:329 stop:865 length:537 start_codon:yes stop_codon:yes gene_type:complete